MDTVFLRCVEFDVEEFEDNIAFLDLDTKEVTWASTSQHPWLTEETGKGVATILDGSIVCLYRVKEELVFQLDRRVYPIDEFTDVELVKGDDGTNRLTISNEKGTLLDWTYTRPVHDLIEELWEVAPGITEEIADFGVFLYNLSKAPERISRIYREPIPLGPNAE